MDDGRIVNPPRVTIRIGDDHPATTALPPDRLARLLGVYTPQQDTTLIGDVVETEIRAGERVLDVCTGSGALAVRAARRSATPVTAVDVSRRSSLVVRRSARRAGVPLRVRRGDLFAPVVGERFDLVVANPPYVPARGAEVPRRGRRRAWDAGTDGRLLVDRICREVGDVLTPGGRLLLVQSEFTGLDATWDLLRAAGFDTRVVARCEHPFGPVLRRRAHHLERGGLLEPGRRSEELVVLRAER